MEAKFKAILDKLDSPLWNAHVRIPTSTAKKFIKENAKRILCNINGIHEYPCAIMSNGGDYYFILVNKPLAKKLKIVFGSELNIAIKQDTSEYGMPMPEELEAVMAGDAEYENYFKNLTPGKQRNLIYYIGKYKSTDLKIQKSIVVGEHLKANKGKLDFKMLFEALKVK